MDYNHEVHEEHENESKIKNKIIFVLSRFHFLTVRVLRG